MTIINRMTQAIARQSQRKMASRKREAGLICLGSDITETAA
jgi:hypothetical protein